MHVIIAVWGKNRAIIDVVVLIETCFIDGDTKDDWFAQNT